MTEQSGAGGRYVDPNAPAMAPATPAPPAPWGYMDPAPHVVREGAQAPAPEPAAS